MILLFGKKFLNRKVKSVLLLLETNMTLKKVYISLTCALPGVIQGVLVEKAQKGMNFDVSSLYQFELQSPMHQALYHEAVVCSWDTPLSIDESRDIWHRDHMNTTILLYGNDIDKQQQVPHPALKKRDHFMFPLLELMPKLMHPDGSSIMQACSQFGESKLVRKIARQDLLDHVQFIEESIDSEDFA